MTPTQGRLYGFLLSRKDDLVQPSIRELANEMKTSRASIHRMLGTLEAEGLVEKLDGNNRCWRALHRDPFKPYNDSQLFGELARRGWHVQFVKKRPDDQKDR